MRLLLDYCCSGSQRSSRNNVTDLHLDDVAAAQLAVGRKVEQSAVAQTSMLVEEKADSPHIARFQRSLRANRVARVPRTASVRVRIEVVYSHDTTPSAVAADGRLSDKTV